MAKYSRNHLFFAASTMIMLAAAIYTSIRLIWGLSLPIWGRVCLSGGVLLLSQSISLMRMAVVRYPGLPMRWLRPGGFFAAWFVSLTCLTCLRDILLLVFWLLKNAGLPFSFSWLLTPDMAVTLACGSLVLTLGGMYSALRIPRVREYRICLPHLPLRLSGLRIAHLSDLHVGSTFDERWLERVIQRVNAQKVDLVLITGDLVDGRPAVLGKGMRRLTGLHARMGVLISLGNHEYYSGAARWTAWWRQLGLTVLQNEHRVFCKNGVSFVVAGITDDNATHFPGLPAPDPAAARQGAPDAFSILLAHHPGNARRHARLGYDLQLSGHTHGGQFFFMFPLVSWLNKGYRSGLYEVNGMKLYVSPGTGMWGYVPMRLGTPSEITVLTLYPQI